MTFTIIGYCDRTRKIGVCKTTGTPLGGGRSFGVVPGKGAYTVQSSTSFDTMHLAAKLLELGYSSAKVLSELMESDEFIDYRQIGIVDINGRSAAYTGPKSKAKPGWSGHIASRNFVAAGNLLSSEDVVKQMANAFEKNNDEDLEERLLRSIEAGLSAGGQLSPRNENSAALLVWDMKYQFPIINLRVDVALKPVTEIRRIFDWYRPLIPLFIKRNLDPSSPSVSSWRDWCDELGQSHNPYS